MINLLRAEASRAFARRIVWLATLLAFAGCLLAFYGNSYSIRPVGEAERASATQAYEETRRDWDQNKERYCGGNQQCMDNPPNLDDWIRKPATFADSSTSMLQSGSIFAFLTALVIGASLLAAEFATGSISTLLSFVPNRTTVFSAKWLVTGVVALSVGVAVVGASLAGTTAAFALVGRSADIAISADIWGRAGRGVVLALIGGLLGYTLAALLKHTAAVVGVVLGYAFLMSMVGGFLFMLDASWLRAYTPETNLMALLDGRFVYNVVPVSVGSEQTIEYAITWGQALGYWAVLVALLTAASWYVFRRHDIG